MVKETWTKIYKLKYINFPPQTPETFSVAKNDTTLSLEKYLLNPFHQRSKNWVVTFPHPIILSSNLAKPRLEGKREGLLPFFCLYWRHLTTITLNGSSNRILSVFSLDSRLNRVSFIRHSGSHLMPQLKEKRLSKNIL